MTTALISGSTGKIGARFLEKHGHQFKKVYRLIGPDHHADNNDIVFDLGTNDKPELPDVDVFFHFAAQTSIPLSSENPILNHQINTRSFLNLLHSMAASKKRPFVVLASTATQVGYTNSDIPISEDAPDHPITIYDVNKLCAELLLLNYIQLGHIDGCSLRLTNVFGSGSTGYSKGRGVIDQLFSKALLGKDLTIFGDGHFIRDYIYLDDVVDAFYLAWKRKVSTTGKKFLVGSGVGTSLLDAFRITAQTAEKLTGKTSQIKHTPLPKDLDKINKRSFIADTSQFRNATGWSAKFSLEQGLVDAFNSSRSFKDVH